MTAMEAFNSVVTFIFDGRPRPIQRRLDGLPEELRPEARRDPIGLMFNRIAMAIRLREMGDTLDATPLERQATIVADFFGADICRVQMVAGLLADGLDFPDIAYSA